MNASCTFGISIGTGTSRGGHHDWTQEQPPAVTSVDNHHQQHHNLIQYDDGLCPYSDEKEVVVEDDNLGQQTIWNSATTSHHNISNEDSRSTETATSSALNGPHDASASSARSRLPCTRAWHLTKTAVKNASTSTSKYLTILPHDESSHAVCDYGLTGITREEFEALPLTIQRKHFSAVERLRLAKDLSGSDLQNPHSTLSPFPYLPDTGRAVTAPSESGKDPIFHRWTTAQRSSAESRSCDIDSRHHPRLSSLDQELLTRLPDKVKRRHLSKEEQILARHQQFIARHRNTIEVPEDADKERTRRIKQLHHLDLAEILESCSTASVCITTDMPIHELSSVNDAAEVESKGGHDFYDTLRWLEQHESLDLRLCLDDPSKAALGSPQRQDVDHPPIRRHLSLSSKLPFARTSIAQVRPSTNESQAAPRQRPTLMSHARTKSRALSIISGQKHIRQDSSVTSDLAATHYQDPEARMRLRSYLASPQKFDEAVEFGFPSVGEERPVQLGVKRHHEEDPLHQLRTWLKDDSSSTCSDESSTVDSESPRTPTIVDRPAPTQQFREPPDATLSSQGEQSQFPMREMTLRMTLTRPDLRAYDSEIYGWQQNPHHGRPIHVRAMSAAQVTTSRQMTPKSSIERHFSALDQAKETNASYDNRALKRFWNRVRRA